MKRTEYEGSVQEEGQILGSILRETRAIPRSCEMRRSQQSEKPGKGFLGGGTVLLNASR